MRYKVARSRALLSPDFPAKSGDDSVLMPGYERQVALKIDRITGRGRAPLFLGLTVVCAAALLSGCMSAPTYGTDKTSSEQLLDDMTSIVSIGPGSDRKPEIAYNPRPGLVRPKSLEVLPEPQQEIASNNPAWPESPEQRRARIRAEATANQGNPHYRPSVRSSAPGIVRNLDDAETEQRKYSGLNDAQRADMTKKLRERNQGDPNVRRYLSEPPVDYRRPSDNAVVGDIGEDELKKQRRLERESGKTTGLRSLLPWL